MEDETQRSRFDRRSFLRTSAKVGLGAAAVAAIMNPLASLTALAAGPKGGFVSTKGTDFMLGDNVFYYGGTNNYYLHSQSHFMIDDVIKSAVAMNLAVVRMWGFLDGKPSNGIVMQPEPGVYPEEGYERFDYTVWKAGEAGLKLVVALVNNWDDFGGMNQYVSWLGGILHDEFYSNEKIKTAYKNYVQNFLNRKNRYTGRVMIEEPAIMTWELANEPRCALDWSGNRLFEWVQEMSSFIKSMDPYHLVAVGDEGFYRDPWNLDWTRSGVEGVDWKRLIALPTIDYGTLHLYPDNGWGKDEAWALQWIKDHIHDGHAAGKPVVLEEFGWHDVNARDDIYRTWTDLLYQEGGNGDHFWLLTGLQDDGTLYPNYDGFRVTYPSTTASILAAHAAQMREKSSRF